MQGLDEDLALLRAVEAGGGAERAAFAGFVRMHEPAMRRYLRSLVSAADAADAAQETFFEVWRVTRAGQGFRGEGTVRSWLFAIARHAAWRRNRRRAGEPPVHEDVDAVVDLQLGCAAGWGDDPEQLLAAAESQAAVRAALARLPDADREILALRDIAGLSGPDVAATLRISLAAEKSRLHRARLLLMAALREPLEHA